jgi:ribosomal subunit interface protein
MNIIIKSKNLEFTDGFKKYAEDKINSLKKFVEVLNEDIEIGKDVAEFFVEIEKETKHHRKGEIFLASGKLVLPGKTIVVSAKKDDILTAIVAMVDAFQVEVKQYKLKNKESIRREQRKSKKILLATDETELDGAE